MPFLPPNQQRQNTEGTESTEGQLAGKRVLFVVMHTVLA